MLFLFRIFIAIILCIMITCIYKEFISFHMFKKHKHLSHELVTITISTITSRPFTSTKLHTRFLLHSSIAVLALLPCFITYFAARCLNLAIYREITSSLI